MVSKRKKLLVAAVLCLVLPCILVTTAAAQRAVGACCMPDGSCSITTELLCDAKGGTFLGLNTTCDDCPPVCDDGDPCTEDSWNGRQCVFEPLDCDDGNPCTTDSCFMGRCSHVPMSCDDDNPCTTDSCVDGECVSEPLDCDDGDPCTSDLCYVGECGHEQIPCDDKDPCTTDSCVGGDCVYTPVDCDDGDACTEDSCVGGDCIYEPLNCEDGNPCTTDACVDGDCVYEPLDCDDGNDRTEDSCREGACEHTLVKAPTGAGNEEAHPSIWFVDEAPWGELETRLHQALCAGATLAGAKFRALLYRSQDVTDIEQLLVRLPSDQRPALIFGSPETIRRIDPRIAEETLFFDTTDLQELLETGPATPLVGLPGAQREWIPVNEAMPPLNGKAQPPPDAAWDPMLLPDPLAWIEQLAALKPLESETGEPSPGERILAEFELLQGATCQLIFSPLRIGAENGSMPVRICCAEDCKGDAPLPEVITPSIQQMAQHASTVAKDGFDLKTRLALWFALSNGLDIGNDLAWQQVSDGHPPLDDDQTLVDAFRQWLTAIGHIDMAERITQQVPFPENSLGYAVRFLWFKAQFQHVNPSNVPWWQHWIENAASQVETESKPLSSPLFLILAQIDPASGEWVVDLLSQ